MDKDGFCDQPIQHPFQEYECLDYCERHRPDPQDRDHCFSQCSSDVPDNCIDYGEPACGELAQALADGALDPLTADFDACKNLFHNSEIVSGVLYQPDADNDGIGDQCEDRSTVSFLGAFVWEGEVSRIETTEGPGGHPPRTVLRTCEVSQIKVYLQTHLGAYGESTEPMTVSACDCDANSPLECAQKCIDDHKYVYDPIENTFSFRWAPCGRLLGKPRDLPRVQGQH